MKFVDLQEEYRYFKNDIDNVVSEVLESGQYLFGKQLEKLEHDFPKLMGKKYGIGVKNCTDAISITLRRVEQIKGKGFLAILPNFGAYPTAVATKLITDQIYYIDVDDTMTLDPEKLPKDLKNGVILPVNLFGNNCNIFEIQKYARENSMMVIEDCAQSCGSVKSYDSDFSLFSFYPTKNLSGMGDGGMILTDFKDDMEYFKKLRFYGQDKGKVVLEYGVNSRMDEIQCGIINVKLHKFQKLNDIRNSIANRYNKIVKGMKINKYGIGLSKNPKCVYHQYVLQFNERDKIIEELNKRDIPYMIHYPHHIPDMEVMKCGLNDEVGYRVNNKVLSLPVHPFMREIEVQQVEEFLNDFKSYEV